MPILLVILLAEDPRADQLLTVLSYVATAITTGGLLKAADWWLSKRDRDRAGKAVEDKTAIDYYKDLVERSKRNLDDLEQEHARAVEENVRLKVKQARQDMYVESLEERLDAKGERYRKWRDTPGTLPPSPTPPPEPKGNGSSHNLPAPPRPTPPPPGNDPEGGL